MPKINLLYVITKLELGGAQKQLLSLITLLDRRGYNVFLFTEKNGLLVHKALSIDGLVVGRSKWLERPINPLKDFFALIEICRFVKKNKIKLVHTHSSKAGILGRWAAELAGAETIIHTVHGWSFNDYQPWLRKKFFVWLERLTARFTDRFIVVSRCDKQRGLTNRIGTEDKYKLIPYGIDYTEFSGVQGQGIRSELGIGSQDLVIGMIACFKPQKCPQDFIKLAHLVNQTMPNVKYVLVGDGILRKQIERLILKFSLQKQVILTGWRSDIAKILSAIDVFVLTSLWEGLPVTVLEAMAASRPVVASNTGGIAEVIKEGENGFLTLCRDINNMSERLIALLKNEALRKQISQNTKNSLGFDFSIENMVRNTQVLYENLIEKTGKDTIRKE